MKCREYMCIKYEI
uniref:Uncharacterized protein n=1 Tax=Arundo donax TaxID=35708 RepID=A0A0A9B9P5_ARUDO